jgi:hypothetical protein
VCWKRKMFVSFCLNTPRVWLHCNTCSRFEVLFASCLEHFDDWTWSWGQKSSPSLLWLNCIRRHSSCNSTPFGSAQRDLSKLKWTAMVAQ